MTWNHKLVVRILLLICRTLTDDPVLREELKHLATHVTVNAPEHDMREAA